MRGKEHSLSIPVDVGCFASHQQLLSIVLCYIVLLRLELLLLHLLVTVDLLLYEGKEVVGHL